MRRFLIVLVGATLLVGGRWPVAADPPAAPAARSWRVPYQFPAPRHVLVRMKLNGKGPFNFILDTGAPAVFISKAAGAEAGLVVDDKGWANIAELEVEGGIKLKDSRAVVEDPFQLTGMNRLNAMGRTLHGMIGYTLLARYRITYDFTDTHLTWTEIDWEPPALARMRPPGSKESAEMEAMAGFAKFATGLMGRRPDPVWQPRGFLGIELEERDGQVIVSRVQAGSPAADKLLPGDVLASADGSVVTGLAKLQEQAAKWKEGKTVTLIVRRGAERIEVDLVTGKGV